MRLERGNMEGPMRIELAFDSEGVELLEELKSLTGLSGQKEFFNNTVTLFDWAVLQRMLGRIVASMDEQKKDYRELVMPPLQYAGRLNDAVRLPAIRKRLGELTVPTYNEVMAVGRASAAGQNR
jgi:hypothetical protein